MTDGQCPNMNTCRLVRTDEVEPDRDKREHYINRWCKGLEEDWNKCKRYQVRKELGLCADFVVPDTGLGIEEIMDKFEEEH
mgnify:FL=1